MKFNWGHGITIFILLFMGFIVTLVIKTFNHNADLVDDNFYEQEALYDGKKQSIVNYKNSDIEIKIEQRSEGISVSFPHQFTYKSGIINFYRADSKKLDKSYILKLDSNNVITLDYSDFMVGQYEINIAWKNNDLSYLYQSTIHF